jgi:4-hydroxybenzoate polyprenyltransferase
MLDRFSQRLLTLLQFTRMALVFTAVSNSLCTLQLSLRHETPAEVSILSRLDMRQVGLVALASIGLYGFGMSLNDIIDRRRDRQLAAHRPLPSGRIGLSAAHVVCGSLLLLACAAGAVYSKLSAAGVMSFSLVIWTALLITFYDFAGKYLVAPGLLTLGLIRFFHAVIPAPQLPLLWHPLLLFNHVAILSAVAYAWEEKRPTLTRLHWWAVLGGVAFVDVMSISIVWWKSVKEPGSPGLWIVPGLALPLALVPVFGLVAWQIRRSSDSPRQAGQTLMLYGLLWLIAYDSAFVAGYVGPTYGLVHLMLLPVSYLLVQFMRWWAKLVLLSQQPTYKRARNGAGPGNQR